MAYYKITSLTSKLGKRHIDKNSVLGITYKDGFNEKNHMLQPGASFYISTPSLPINLHRLRMKKLITVVELNKNTFMKLNKPKHSIAVVLPVAKKVEPKLVALDVVDNEEEKPTKKRPYKKKEE